MNFFPEQTGVGKYSGEMAFWLSKNQHDVKVIAAPPYYPHWKVHKNYTPEYHIHNNGYKELHQAIKRITFIKN